MRHRYEPPTDPAAWAFHQTHGTGDPYRDPPTVISAAPPATMIEEFPGEARAAGLSRLSRLTWRATQLSAVTAVGIATLFARTAPAQTTAQAAPAHSAKQSASASPSGSHASSAGKRRHIARPRANLKPTAQPGQAASSSASSSGTSGSSGGGSGSSPSPTLAPPKSTPAPAPPPSSAPAPPPTTSSGSHGGG
jgi:hypothetical protein